MVQRSLSVGAAKECHKAGVFGLVSRLETSGPPTAPWRGQKAATDAAATLRGKFFVF
jgi:hypothetical protein